MNDYPYKRKPAFFRVMSPELFFEAELDETVSEETMMSQGAGAHLDSTLDSILGEAAAR